MYTGIVKHLGTVVNLDEVNGVTTIHVSFPAGFDEDLEVGASVAINGTCFTVTSFDAMHFCVNAVDATLRITNTKSLKVGDRVNLERSAKLNEEIGGHLLSGHVISTAKVHQICIKPANAAFLVLQLPDAVCRFVFEKGFIGINGASLTIGEFDPESRLIKVNLIPETLRMTTFSNCSEGDEVNIEIDIATITMVNTIERTLNRLNLKEYGTKNS